MLKIRLIAVGKLKNNNFRNSFEDYIKRVSPYAKLDVVEIEPEPFFDNSNKEKIKQKEGEKILRYLSKVSTKKIFILDENGREFDSKSFSEQLFLDENKEIVFVIGGTLGLSKEVLNYQNSLKLALSKLTIPHELARVFLVEQIFRAIAINKNKSYHY